MENQSFDEWLCEKIKFLQLDEDIYLDYLKGVLDEDCSSVEKEETIINILEGATEEPIADICKDIITKWSEAHKTQEIKQNDSLINNGLSQADDKIRDIIHKQQETVAILKPVEKTEDEVKRRLLEQYAHVSEGDESDDDGRQSASKHDDSQQHNSLFENINAKSVVEQQRQQREKQKKAADEKKEKDKVNREAEKVKKQERQEKEKKRTQKGERKR